MGYLRFARRMLAGWLLVLACAPNVVAEVPAVASPPAAERGVHEAVPTASPCPECETNSDPSSVFFVQRNKNRNEVHYGIRLDAECRPEGGAPVYNYWLRLGKGPAVTEPLSVFQQLGYGVRRQDVGADHVEVVLRALPARTIRIVPLREPGRCRAAAYMEIAGAESRFERAFVYAEEGLLLPSVKYIDLYGRTSDGRPVHEHVPID